MNEIAIGGMCAVLITVLSRDEKPIEDVKCMNITADYTLCGHLQKTHSLKLIAQFLC